MIPQPLPSSQPPTWTTSPLPSSTKPATTTQTLPPIDTFTPIPSETPLPTFTFTPTISPEPQWSVQGPGDIIVPILLYHHIGISPSNSEYYISPAVFEQQMSLLYEWGYQTISVELMVKAIKEGAELPIKPIILTFDDGSESVYTTALPTMQKYGFTGTVYLVYNYIGASQYMDVKEARELYAAGWEIGSHGISHVDLTTQPGRQEEEIVESRWKLQNLLDISILTFAYPYGAYDEDSVYFALYAGYIGAMGLGVDTRQGINNQYYLYRRDIKGSYDMLRFASFLPWQGDLTSLPVPTTIIQ